MSSRVYWLSFAIASGALVMISGVGPAPAKTVNVCASVTLPAPGKCTYLRVRGFKVRVCR
jgi:hypothetical protein